MSDLQTDANGRRYREVVCPEPGCLVTARGYTPDGPYALPEELWCLLNGE